MQIEKMTERKFVFKRPVALSSNNNTNSINQQQQQQPKDQQHNLLRQLDNYEHKGTSNISKHLFKSSPSKNNNSQNHSKNEPVIPAKKSIFAALNANKPSTPPNKPPSTGPSYSQQSKKSGGKDQTSLLNFFNKNSQQKSNTDQNHRNKQSLPNDSDDDWEQIEKNVKLKSPPVPVQQPPSIEKKPIAAVKPQIQPKQTPSPAKKTSNNKLSYEDNCQICETKYVLNDKTSIHRKMTDSCGHSMCVNCVCKGELCKICNPNDDDDEELPAVNDKDENIQPITKQTIKKQSPVKQSPIKKPSPSIQPPRKQIALTDYLNGIEDEDLDPCVQSSIMSSIKQSSTNNSDKLFEMGAQLSKQFNSTTPSAIVSSHHKPSSVITSKPIVSSPSVQPKPPLATSSSSKPTTSHSNKRDIVYVNSDDDDVDLIIEEHIDLLDEPQKSNKQIPTTSNKSNFTVIHDQNEDDIDELDDDELFILSCINSKQQQQQQSAQSDTSSNNFGVTIPDLKTYDNSKWLFNDIKDCAEMYRGFDYPHTERLLESFRNLFGLKGFRAKQFEAINAALLGHHVFILFPTGAGKSLCYQLPAIITQGVTFIVSPLKSLIVDQVQKLNALNLPAAHLISDSNNKASSESEYIYMDLYKKEPTLRLIYITPEKLGGSEKLSKALSSLYARNMIARFVIDEAHCISNWGHDFRPDYKQLGSIRNRLFPNVPMMLLTATATPRVRKDILLQMNLLCDNQSAQPSHGASYNQRSNFNNNNKQHCAFFIQSFNRSNLQYSVEYKTSNKAALEKVLTIIKSKFSNKSGIIYCISRNECESVSDFLQKNGIKSLPYHAGMSDKQRTEIQGRWSNNKECKVVCATIAFGMGIDKADVRFVIHLGLPKSLEGYYQESGRAGRDGLVSHCILFYNNQDRHKWLRLMKQEQTGNSNYEIYKVHLDNLYRMSQYCDNRTDCRRAQVLEYFGEIFDRQKCIENKQTTCDNCIAFQSNAFALKDITEDAKCIVKGVKELNGMDVTLLHLSEVLKGSMNSKIMEKQHNSLEMHGRLCRYKKTDIERIIRRLIFDGFLSEDVKILTYTDTVASYVKIGHKANTLLFGNVKIQFDIRGDERDTQTTDNTQDDDDDDDEGGGSKKPVKQKKATKSLAAAVASCSSARSNSKAKSNENPNNEIASKLADLSAENRIRLRCKNDLKQLTKRICTEKGVQNVNSIFTANMLKEMILNMPQTREDLLRITYFTEAIYMNYRGEEFLTIFRHYGKQLDDLRMIEELENFQKSLKTSGNVKMSAADAALFDSESEDNEWLSKSEPSKQSVARKRTAASNTFSNKKTKKSKGDNDEDGYSSSYTSSYFNSNNNNNNSKYYKKNNSNKKKFWKFKKFKKN